MIEQSLNGISTTQYWNLSSSKVSSRSEENRTDIRGFGTHKSGDERWMKRLFKI